MILLIRSDLSLTFREELFFYFAADKVFKLFSLPPSKFSLYAVEEDVSNAEKDKGLDHLPPEIRARLVTLLSKYADVLTTKMGLTQLIEYEIQLTDHTPVKSSPDRLAPPKMDVIRQLVDQLLRDGVIQLSRSRYSSPVFLVLKPNNSYRAVVDYK